MKEVPRFTALLAKEISRFTALLAARLCSLMLCLLIVGTMPVGAARSGSPEGVVIHPREGQARVVSLQVVGEGIVRVRATSAATLPQKAPSLIVVPQQGRPRYAVEESAGKVTVTTARLQAEVERSSGRVTFRDAAGNVLLREADDGKRFWPYRVPDREIGVDSARVGERQRHGLTWQMRFDSPADEAFYGLGQHQSEELNMKGRSEELFQYNTKVSVPFVVSSKNYGLLWDSYSYCRFGQADDYLQLGQAFRLYDRQGREGALTGTYTDRSGKTLVRQEDSLYYEYDVPQSAAEAAGDQGGIRNLPKGFSLSGATVVYEGFLSPRDTQDPEQPWSFMLYYAGYVKVYVGGELVVPERWRTAWNPNSYKFTARVPGGRLTQLRIEWRPDGGVSYCGLRVARQRTPEEQGRLSVWSEMAQDMDYYFMAGSSLDEVIAAYRTLTGRAPVYPKWVLGYWQSRERYKTQDELVATLAEFRRRHLPIDNIVQDWNYWPEDQWGSHRFDGERFPSPRQMLDTVHQMHGRLMISVWPKFYCATDNYKELDGRGWMYHQAVSDSIRDWVGPGYVGSFYDAYAEGARKMFWRQMDDRLYTGLGGKDHHSLVDAWWMDASEPNVRDCTPMWYRKALCGPTALGTSTEYFNAYSLVNAEAIYDGQRETWKRRAGKGGRARRAAESGQPEPRVFLLIRSGFAGLQRYSAATWSGDIGTRWEDMRAQMTAGLNYSLSGLPFWGMDMGGFCVENRYVKAQQHFDRTGQESEDLLEWRELQTRWAQFGAFVPLFRAHGQWPLREPWHIAGIGAAEGGQADAADGTHAEQEEQSAAYRSFAYYDRLRYQLMPYLYSMAGWVHLRDYTMMRALVMDFGHDHHTHDIKDQWMFGPSLMACPVSHYKARSRSVYFPAGRGWYDLYTGAKVMGPDGGTLVVDAPSDRIPVFVPEGSILPLGPAMEWSDEKPAALITLYVYAGRDARFDLYEDEGTNYNYEQGRYATISISYDDAARTLTFGRRQGSFSGMLKERRFNVVYVTPYSAGALGLSAPGGRMVEYDGEPVTVRL